MQDTGKSRESIIEKAQKLLAMAEDTAATANEKLVAAAKVSKLMFQFNLDMSELKLEEQQPYTDQTFSLGTAYKWRLMLAVLLCKFNFCEHVTHSTKFRVVGRKDNIEWVIWLHKHIRKQIEHMAEEYLAKTLQGKSDYFVKTYKGQLYTSFCKGCVDTIHMRLQQERDELLQDDNNRALVVVEDSALREHLLELVPNLRIRQEHNQKIWGNAYGSGREAAQNISMRRQIQ